MNENIPFKLFTNCLPVRGASRSTICDLERDEIHLIPNSLYDLLIECSGMTIQGVKANYSDEHHSRIDEYFSFLISNDLILFDAELSNFPELDLTWESPSQIIYCILDVDRRRTYNTNNVAEQLSDLDCRYLEIRFFDALSLEEYEAYIRPFKLSTIISVSLLIPFDEVLSIHDLSQLIEDYNFITGITVHSCPIDLIPELNINSISGVTYIHNRVNNEACCGIIKPEQFVSTIDTYTEALKFNSCLNRKISVDKNGEIKNCPSMPDSFGNINRTTLVDALAKPEIKRYWTTSKNSIQTCKDCEFRYVCSDCRAYLENPNDQFSKPLKCGYDPYNCEWMEWADNPIKLKGIQHYGLTQ